MASLILILSFRKNSDIWSEKSPHAALIMLKKGCIKTTFIKCMEIAKSLSCDQLSIVLYLNVNINNAVQNAINIEGVLKLLYFPIQ